MGRPTLELESGARDDGQLGKSTKGRVRFRPLTQDESAATVVLDHAGVSTRGTQAGAIWRPPRLPAVGAIVHHLVMFTSDAVTHGVRVTVRSEYAPDRSRPSDQEWYFAYTITIANESARTVQLLSRHWIITNAIGEVKHVEGPGVIGQYPVLAPGESFTYTSGCPLATSFGRMEGTYQMTVPGGESFDVLIAPFTLSEPYTVQH